MASVSCFARGVVHFLSSSLLAAVVDRPRSTHDEVGCARRRRLRAPRGILLIKLDFIVSFYASVCVLYLSAIVESWVSRIEYQTWLIAVSLACQQSVRALKALPCRRPWFLPRARPPYAVPLPQNVDLDIISSANHFARNKHKTVCNSRYHQSLSIPRASSIINSYPIPAALPFAVSAQARPNQPILLADPST